MNELSDKPSELFHLALQRAKMNEILAMQSGEKDTGSYFLIGLFSTLDAILDIPIGQAIEKLNLSEQATEALTSREGKAWIFLENIIHYQKWELDEVDINLGEMSDAFCKSLAWEKEVTSNL